MSPRRTTVAVQGYAGSFHDQAANLLFDRSINLLPCASFEKVFQAVAGGRADFAVCAIENSLYGAINEVYDLLLRYRFWISGELYLKVEQCLIGSASALNEISEVYSHPVALAQCSNFLDTSLAEADRHEHEDTAGAVADIKQWGDPRKAAIAGAHAAQLYGLNILVQGIENDKHNYTRFVVLSAHPQVAAEATKTSLLIDTRHTPGALYQALGAFAEHAINLSMLTSRPIAGDPGHYRFYADVTVGASSSAFLSASNKIKAAGGIVNVLGSYPAASLPWNGANDTGEAIKSKRLRK